MWLQKWMPAALAEGLRVEALYERIPDLVEQLVAEADALVADASDVLERFYQQEVRPSLGDAAAVVGATCSTCGPAASAPSSPSGA